MFQLLAVCPMGLEAVVAKEIQELGYDTQVENGRIFFEGDESAIVRNMMSKMAIAYDLHEVVCYRYF